MTFESFVSYVPNFLNAHVTWWWRRVGIVYRIDAVVRGTAVGKKKHMARIMHSGGVSELGDLVGDL